MKTPGKTEVILAAVIITAWFIVAFYFAELPKNHIYR